jgi:anti-sigma B factor antagonist
MGSKLEIQVAERHGWAVLIVQGEFDVLTAPRVRDHLLDLLSAGRHQVVVDLEGVQFLDSSGLGALVAGLKLARRRDGNMRLVCHNQRSVLKVLQVTGLDRILDCYSSVDAAVAA